MRTVNSPGYFITLESVDGLGKTDQIVRLSSHLTSIGCTVQATKEPGDLIMGSPIGVTLRTILFDTPGMNGLVKDAANLLLLADHIQNASIIEQYLRQGKIVISDRYTDSQFAYWDPYGNISELYKHYLKPKPDLTIYLEPLLGSDGTLKWVFDRANTRSIAENTKQANKMWNTLEQFHITNNKYLNHFCAEQSTRNISIVPVLPNDSKEEVFRKVLDAVKQHYGKINPKVYL